MYKYFRPKRLISLIYLTDFLSADITADGFYVMHLSESVYNRKEKVSIVKYLHMKIRLPGKCNR